MNLPLSLAVSRLKNNPINSSIISNAILNASFKDILYNALSAGSKDGLNALTDWLYAYAVTEGGRTHPNIFKVSAYSSILNGINGDINTAALMQLRRIALANMENTCIVAPANINPSSRDRRTLEGVISQLDVENNERYKPNRLGIGDTYCNIFVLDVMRAMHVKLPNTNASGIFDWLSKQGDANGFRRVTGEEAQRAANEGKPVICAWRNYSGGHSHVQIVRPSDAPYDPSRGPAVAQAGSKNFENGFAVEGLGRTYLKQAVYYVHD